MFHPTMVSNVDATVTDPDFAAFIRNTAAAVGPYTMVPDYSIEVLIQAVRYAAQYGVPGNFIECGVWKGGCAAAMELTRRFCDPTSSRRVHLFDSFDGLPAVADVDGPLAADWQSNTHSSNYYDNCRASFEDVKHNLMALGIAEAAVTFHKGWFEETVPAFAENQLPSSISVLRLDGDWYSSTITCLRYLYPLVSENGIVLIDDYYTWEGCALAVNEYLGQNHLKHVIKPLPNYHGAYFEKRNH